MLLQTLRDVSEGVTMKRCRICKGIHDVRADGLCGGCYDNRLAGQFGMSYGRFVALYGHNFLRRDYPPERRRQCPVCGRVLSPTAGKKLVFCSSSCAAEAVAMREEKYRTANGRKTCRGCRYYVTGSKRCTNQSGPFFNQSHGAGCGAFKKKEKDNGEN